MAARLAVGPPWFDRYTVPLALALVLLSGIGPVIAWRRATLANARRNFTAPVLLALATLAALLAVGAQRKPLALAMFACAAFVVGSIAQEFFRGTRARRAIAHERVPIARAGSGRGAKLPRAGLMLLGAYRLVP